MAGDWMQIDCDLPEKAETQRICDLTGEPIEAVLGRLMLFWRWVERHATSERIDGATCATVARLCAGSAEFWRAVESSGWIRFEEDAVVIPGWKKRFSKSAKRRALAARRMLRSRATSAQRERNGRVTKRRVEKSREETTPNGVVTPLPPGLDNEAFRTALTDWLAYKTEKRQPYKPQGLASMISRADSLATKHGIQAVVEAMQRAMSNGWQGWDQANAFDQKGGSSGNRKPYTPNPATEYVGPDAG